jgi:hypothetical protein
MWVLERKENHMTKKIIIISNQGLQEVDVPFEKDHHMFICRVEGICIWITR